MNIDFPGYTTDAIVDALLSASRQVRYEYTISDSHDANLGNIEITDGHISFDSTAEVMRTMTGRVKKSDLLNLDTIDYRVTPWMCLMMPNKKEAKIIKPGRQIVKITREMASQPLSPNSSLDQTPDA